MMNNWVRTLVLSGIFFVAIAAIQAQSEQGQCYTPDAAFLQSNDPDCYAMTLREADKAFKKRCWDEAGKLYRAAKLCRDANQDDRAHMNERIEACRLAAKAELEGEKNKAIRQARHAIAANRANDAQELLRNNYRSTAYRLALFANEYIAPEKEDNPDCLQAILDAWQAPVSTTHGRNEILQPFCYELMHNIGDSVSLRFAPTSDGLSLLAFAPDKNELFEWAAPDFSLKGHWAIDTTMEHFDLSPDGNIALFYSGTDYMLVLNRQRSFSIKTSGTGVYCFSPDSRFFYYYDAREHAIFSVALAEVFQQQYTGEKTRKNAVTTAAKVERVFTLRHTTRPKVISQKGEDFWIVMGDSLGIISPLSLKTGNTRWALRNWIPLRFAGDSTLLLQHTELSIIPDQMVVSATWYNGYATSLIEKNDRGDWESKPLSKFMGAQLSADHRVYYASSGTGFADILLRSGHHIRSDIRGDFWYKQCAALSPETPLQPAEWLALAHPNGSLQLWPLKATVGTSEKPAFESIETIACSANGRYVGNAGNGTKLQICRPDGSIVSGPMCPFTQEAFGPTSIAISNNGWVACANLPNDTILLTNGTQSWLFPTLSYTDPEVVFDPSGKYVAMGLGWDSVAVLELSNPPQWIAGKRFDAEIDEITFVPGHPLLAIQRIMRGDEPPVSITLPLIWDYRHPAVPVKSVRLENFYASEIVPQYDGKVIFFTNGLVIKGFSLDSLTDEKVLIRQAQNAIIQTFTTHPSLPILAVALSNGSILVRDANTGKKIYQINVSTPGQTTPAEINQVAFSEDGSQLVVITEGQHLQRYDLDQDLIAQKLKLEGGYLQAFTSEQIGNWELDLALEYDRNFEKLATSGDVPLIRAFFEFYSGQAQSSNRMEDVRNYCQKAEQLYRLLDDATMKAQYPTLLAMYEDYLWKLLQRNQTTGAEAVLSRLIKQPAFRDALPVLRLSGHAALMKKNVSQALQQYILWKIQVSEGDQYENYYEERKFSNELGQLKEYNYLDDSRMNAVCSLLSGEENTLLTLECDRAVPTAPLKDLVRNQKLLLRWQIFTALQTITRNAFGKPFEVQHNLLTDARNDARKLTTLDPAEGKRQTEAVALATAMQLGREADFEQGSNKAVQLLTQAIQTVENGRFTGHFEVQRLDTLAGLYLRKSILSSYTDPAQALIEVEKGLDYASKLVSLFVDFGIVQTGFDQRTYGPLARQKGMILLALDRPIEAEKAFKVAEAKLQNGLSDVYYGHLDVVQQQYEGAFINYGSINTLSEAVEALTGLRWLANHFTSQPQRAQRMMSTADRLESALPVVRPDIDSVELEYLTAYRSIAQFSLTHRNEGALQSSQKALEVARPFLSDTTGRTLRLYDWLNYYTDAAINVSYYTLLTKSTQQDAVQQALQLCRDIMTMHQKHYLRSGNLIYTNAGHLSLLNGDAGKALEYYRKYLDIGFYGYGSGMDVLIKDWRDLQEAGVILPGLDRVRTQIMR